MSLSSWGRDCRFHIPSTTSNSSAINEGAALTGDEFRAGPAVSPQDQFNLAINHVHSLNGMWFCSICDVTILEGRLAALNHLDTVEHKKMRSSYQPRSENDLLDPRCSFRASQCTRVLLHREERLLWIGSLPVMSQEAREC
ncbi:hypothetical protein FOZ61_004783 [Perkinsus olseni]|uniref:Uncharacterized protein n=1 Tax=Perkinsus olseni TaxID=32597 RepID=A0A7J6MC87_PEROL|nr:hypothetical protein FOZ61_004783 [Perkinsus olseni]